MDVSYAKHWKKRQPLEVGHRGMGNSYTKYVVSLINLWFISFQKLHDVTEVLLLW